jgi:two-component system LytT family response regulator
MKELLTAILIDDEISCTETLEIELKQYCPEVEVIKKCNSAKEGLLSVQSLNPDVVFLDIEMPWMSGFELLQSLPHIDFEIVFVTAYDQFAIKAFKFSAIDYLLKPIQKNELVSAVNRVLEKRKRKQPDERIQFLLQQLQLGDQAFAKLALPTMEGLIFIPVDNILYCKSDSNYTHLVKTDGKTATISRPLKLVASMLEEHSFMRIHQSYLINLKHIEKYIKGQGGEVVMSDGKYLPVSRSKKDMLLEKVRV